MSSVKRGLQLIEFVTQATEAPTHADLARHLSIPKSTLSQLLSLLQESSYLALVGRQYYPGIRLAALAYRIAYEGGLRTSIRPAMDQLALRTGETILLGVRVGMAIINVEQSPSPQPIRYVTTLGVAKPIHATATGRVFLAFSGTSSSVLGELTKVTPATVTDPDQLDAILRKVRQDGFAISREEAVVGVTSISAPLLNASGHPIATLSVTGPSERLTDTRERIWPMLRDAIRAIRVGAETGELIAPPTRRTARKVVRRKVKRRVGA